MVINIQEVEAEVVVLEEVATTAEDGEGLAGVVLGEQISKR
jgi:hypothetical protein